MPSDPIRIEVVRWKCPHCNRSRARKTATVAHIARCWDNPDAHGCKTCAYFVEALPMFCGDPGCNGCGNDEECGAGVELRGPGLLINCPKWENCDAE